MADVRGHRPWPFEVSRERYGMAQGDDAVPGVQRAHGDGAGNCAIPVRFTHDASAWLLWGCADGDL